MLAGFKIVYMVFLRANILRCEKFANWPI